MRLIASKVGKHEDLRDPSKPEQDTDAIGKVNRRDGRSQTGKTQDKQPGVTTFSQDRDQNANRRREALNIGLACVVGKSDPFPHVPRGGYRDKRVFLNATRVEPECKSRDESQGKESSEDRIVTERPDDRSGSSLEADCAEIVELHFLSMSGVSA